MVKPMDEKPAEVKKIDLPKPINDYSPVIAKKPLPSNKASFVYPPPNVNVTDYV
jgi:hypothetical protein